MAVSVSRALIDAQSRGIAGSPATPAVFTPESRATSLESSGAASRTRSSRDLQARVAQAASETRSSFRTVDPLAGSTAMKARSSPALGDELPGAHLAARRARADAIGRAGQNARGVGVFVVQEA